MNSKEILEFIKENCKFVEKHFEALLEIYQYGITRNKSELKKVYIKGVEVGLQIGENYIKDIEEELRRVKHE